MAKQWTVLLTADWGEEVYVNPPTVKWWRQEPHRVTKVPAKDKDGKPGKGKVEVHSPYRNRDETLYLGPVTKCVFGVGLSHVGQDSLLVRGTAAEVAKALFGE